MRQPDQVLSRTRLIEHVWDFAYDGGSNAVEVYIRYLREKVDRPLWRQLDRNCARRRLSTTRASRMRLPIRVQLRIAFAVLNAFVLGATDLFLYVRFERDLFRNVDAGLRLRADTLLGSGDPPGFHLGSQDRPIDPDMAFVQEIDSQGRVLQASEVLTEPLLSPGQLEGLATRQFFDAAVVLVDETVEARLFAVASAGGTALVVGTSVEEQGEALAGLARLLWLGAPAALGATTWIAFLLAGAALRPVERMRLEAAAISASQPGRRLPVPATGDEIARLGETLNSMLERMESALERERRFVDDASHELRTPLAILKAELDLALSKSRTREELLTALHSAAEESDRVAAWRRISSFLPAPIVGFRCGRSNSTWPNYCAPSQTRSRLWPAGEG